MSTSPAERWDLIDYLRSIEEPAAQPVAQVEPRPAASAASSPQNQEEGNKSDVTKEPAKGDPGKGKEVFEAHCTQCHVADSEEALIGPGLKGLFHWPPHQLADGTEHKEHTIAIIRKQITEGGGDMPAAGASLSEQELADLIAYLQTL